jgi:hypothetical protein
MNGKKNLSAQSPDSRSESPAAPRRQWEEPKLTFITPKLTRHGKLEEVTGQFFGAFSPGRISTIR